MRHRQLRICFATIGTLVLANGCYGYVAVPSDGPYPDQGTAVRAHLSEPGQFSLRDVTAQNVIQVDGEVANSDGDDLVLSGFWFQSRSGRQHRGVGETVVLRRTSIGRLERKRFSVVRSAALIGVAGLLSILLQASFEGFGGGSERPNPPPPSN